MSQIDSTLPMEYFKTVIAVKFKHLQGQQKVELGNDASFMLNYEKKSGSNYDISINDIQGDIKEVSVIDNGEEAALISSRTYTILSSSLSPVIMINVTYPFKRNHQANVTYLFEPDRQRLKMLRLGEFYEDKFTLPQFDALIFSYSIRSTPYFEDGEEHPYYSLLIKNDKLDIEINGKKGNYECYIFGNESIQLSFAFNIDHIKHQLGLDQYEQVESNQSETFSVDQISQSSFATRIFHTLQNQASFKDAIIVTSDGVEVAAHRCILAAASNVFAAIFETKKNESMVRVEAEFKAELVERAIDFYYAKENAINGFENDVIQFATKYSMTDLKVKCMEAISDSITSENVCEIVEMAFENSCEPLKKKCLEILVKEKSNIDKEKLQSLPPQILVACLTLS